MFKKKYILLFTFFVALFFLLYLFTGFFTKIKEREVNLEGETKKLSETINKPVRKIYTLTPKLKYNEYFLTTTIDTYPYITTSPNDSLYPLILIKEKILLIIRKEKYWTIALKRLAEIHKWGNELSKVKIQNVLANFKTNTEDYLNAISKDRNERNRKIILLKNSLFLHRTELINIIRKLTLSSQDKKELLSFANKIFENLDEKIDFKLPPYNPNKLVYSLKSISPGYYDINPKNYSFQLDNAFPSTSANVKINNYSDLTLYIKIITLI